MNSLTGVIVCGGKSTRMGRDKSLIVYHGTPQWRHLATMMTPLCSRVVISCNTSQANQFSKEYPILVDDAKYAATGPMAAVLTAFRVYPSSSLLVVGCDYPMITADDLKLLIASQQDDADATCFYHEVGQIEEPLLAIYEPSIHPMLMSSFKSADFSLRKVLIKSTTVLVAPASPGNLAPADTPDQSKILIETIGGASS